MKLVRIQSTKTIKVTSGLQLLDVTNPDAHVADRLKVSAEWPKLTVLIKEGVGEYPAEIIEWPTVKALVKDKIFTIGEKLDATTDDQVKEIEKFERDKKSIKKEKKNLDELTT